MFSKLFFLHQVISLFITCHSYRDGIRSDIGLNAVEMIENHGYVCEIHYITTEDGYILTYHRIPSISTSKKPTFLLLHGLFSSSADYVNNGNNSLAFILSDEGYDVWLGNARGNAWSRNHTSLDVKNNSKKFFDFSWHEIGYYDLASAIDYILLLKSEENLMYIGHSQGTTAFMVLASTRPEYNKKIKLAHLLAPAGLMAHCPLPEFINLSARIDLFAKILKQLKVYEVPYINLLQNITANICTHQQWHVICEIVTTGILPLISLKDLDKDLIRVIGTNFPSNAAIKQLMHYGQSIKNGWFAQYDYGPSKNLKKYGSETPPLYDFSKITAAVAVYYSQQDGLVSVEDAKIMIDQLPNAVLDYLVPRPSFTHGDFLFAKDVVSLLYDEILKLSALYQ